MSRQFLIAALLAQFFLLTPAAHTSTLTFNGLEHAVSITRDTNGIIEIRASNDRDLAFAQGWAHARDRFFQMDSLRRQASGTLGELLGPSVLGDDVLLRTLGLRRAAERSQAVISADATELLAAYANGVNAWLAGNPLPSEYEALEITSVAPWEPLDSLTIAKLLAFGLSFDLDVDLTNALTSYQAAGDAGGFDGSALFFEDLYRSAPFDPASTVPDASGSRTAAARAPRGEAVDWRDFDTSWLRPETVAAASEYMERLSRVPFIGDAIAKREGITGSNEWAVSGAHTENGQPIIANDPHLSLDQPSTFYQNRLISKDPPLNVAGSSFTGVPFVVLGQNRNITWGATTNPLDVTDTFQETLAPDPSSAFGLGTVTNGEVEPLELIVLEFRANQIGDNIQDNVDVVGGLDIPPFALIVPRRNNGPVVSLDVGNLSAVSIQFAGFGGTREIDAFLRWNRAENLDDFVEGLQYFDFGSQNWAVADVAGNIAYFTSGELPLREDLQAGAVNGLPPWFIRDGTGGNEWLPVTTPEPGQALSSAILPFDEMPQVVNPSTGYFVNANNDPIGNTLDNNPLNELRPGGGIYYLNPGYATGLRAGRITQALTDRLDGSPVDLADMAEIQANVRLLDAEVFTPLILAAYDAGMQSGADPQLAALAADPRVAEAAGRLANWDGWAPTGVLEGYDASDPMGVRLPPDAAEIEASINASIYSVWRGQFIRSVIDSTIDGFGISSPGSAQSVSALRNLIDRFPADQGIGASGLDFFAVDGVADADTRLAIKTLQSLSDALDLMSGAAFAAAFGNSSDQTAYRWGRLHRIVFDHPLGEPYNIPSAVGPLLPSFSDLPGFAVDGGFGAVDASSHSARADSANEFMFGSGPVRRYVGQPRSGAGAGVDGRTILPGGSSGVLGSEWYANLSERWLTNDTYVLQPDGPLQPAFKELTLLLPAVTRDRGGRAR